MSNQTKAEEILKFHELGMSVDKIADYLGIFTSYVKLAIEQKGEQGG